jgi:hypothetical protein
LIVNVLALAGALAVAAGLRAAFARHAAPSQVDQYYWMLAARYWRKARGLSVRIPGKYLLEDETQAYPPAFGYFLGRLPESALRRWPVALSLIADAATLGVLAALLAFFGAGLTGVAAALAVVAVAPALVTYNAQINPRAFGQLFLSALVVLVVIGSSGATPGWASAALWIGGVACAAMVVITHKMSAQLMLVLWPLLALATWSSAAATVPALGIAAAALLTGPRNAAYQWRAHWDIVRFWNRHHPRLGAHPFAHSPLYGDPARLRESAYHKGLGGVPRHVAAVLGYAPLSAVLPVLLLLGPAPPTWLLTWFFATYAFAFLTLFAAPLKCLGAGHLYVYNAVAPGAVWWGFALVDGGGGEWALFGFGLLLSALSVGIAWRRISRRPNALDADFSSLVENLQQKPPGRVAAFPLTATEAIAYRTDHAVLWGGHGYGFRRLEGLFPVVTRPLAELLQENRIDWLAWNTRYWPGGAEVVRGENIGREDATAYGDWRLIRVQREDV